MSSIPPIGIKVKCVRGHEPHRTDTYLLDYGIMYDVLIIVDSGRDYRGEIKTRGYIVEEANPRRYPNTPQPHYIWDSDRFEVVEDPDGILSDGKTPSPKKVVPPPVYNLWMLGEKISCESTGFGSVLDLDDVCEDDLDWLVEFAREKAKEKDLEVVITRHHPDDPDPVKGVAVKVVKPDGRVKDL